MLRSKEYVVDGKASLAPINKGIVHREESVETVFKSIFSQRES